MFYTLNRIAEEVGSPFYIAHPDLFRENIRNFTKAFCEIYSNFILSYSFKTNYTPFLLQCVKEEGVFAEVVSEIEYGIAELMGFKGNQIILNGPIKSAEFLKKALENGSIINLDSAYEVESIVDYKKQFPNKDVRVGLRINMELNTRNGTSALQGGLPESRFGFTDNVLEEVVPALKNAGIKIHALHGHASTMNHSVENYKIIAKKLLATREKFQLDDIKYLDLGGSFFGAAPKEVDVSKRPTYHDYAQAVCDIFFDDSWFVSQKPYIVAEPGAAVVTNVFELATKIHQHKLINGKNFVSVDASIFQVRPNGKTNYPYVEYSDKEHQPEIIADVVGSTCMEVDKVAEQVKLTHYRNGDYLVFKASGAYRQNLTPFFINPRCAIVELTSDGFKVIRKRQDAKHLLEMLQ